MKKIHLEIFCFLFTASFLLYAQEGKIRFEKLSIEHGLSQSSVITICQDHKGFLWFGTYDGLNRYDGYKFKTFRHISGDTSSLCQNSIRFIYEDRSEILWVGTEDGLSKFNREKENFTNYFPHPGNINSISDNRIRQIIEDRSGDIWISTENGVNRYNPKQNKFVRYFHDPNNTNTISDNYVRAIYEDSKGNMWFGTIRGLDKLDGKTGKFSHYKHETNILSSSSESIITFIYEDYLGTIWFGMRNGGLKRLEKGSNQFINYKYDYNDPGSLRNNSVRGILEDKLRNLWIVTYGGGLEKFDRKRNRFIHYRKNLRDPYSISSDALFCIYEDRTGIIWIGTDFGGINKFDNRKSQFLYFGNIPDDPNGLNNSNINTFYEDPSEKGKTIWIGTWGGGFSKMNRVNNRFTVYRNNPADINSLSNDVVRCITKDKSGIFWIGTDFGLNRFNSLTNKFTRYFHNPNDPGSIRINLIKQVYEDRKGNIWIATNGGGLELYDEKNDCFIHYQANQKDPNSLNDNIIWCILEDDSGILWLGTNMGGLNRFDKSTGKFSYYKKDPLNPKSISDNKVLCIHKDEDNIFWLGTAGGGLNQFDPSTEEFIHYDVSDGLASNTVHTIIEDNNKNLWIGTSQGLTRFDIQKQQFINYNIYDGLQSNEFHVNSATKSITGELFFGGINGFNVFNPENIKLSTFKPNVALTDFQLFNKSVPIGYLEDNRILLEKSIAETKSITLSYLDEVFSIEFAALDFTAPQKNKYAYMMEGFDKDWNYIGNRNFATYTKLPAGKYLFKVKGSNHNGIWGNSYTSLEIIITPPLWETWWFRLFLVVLIFGVVIIGYKVRTSRILAHNRELENRVHERTTQLEIANKELEAFAYSVSHDLRAPLRAIDGFGLAIQEDYRKVFDERAMDYINRIRKNSQKLSRLIDDLLNMSRIARKELIYENVDLSKLAEDTYNELTEFVKNRKIEFKLTDGMHDYVDPQLLKLCFQNLFDNSLKFTKNNEVTIIEVGFETNNGRKIYYVKDNGVGFNEKYSSKLFGVFQRLHSQEEFPGTGIGLATVQKIIHKHKGKIWAESQINKGATFYFTLNEINS